MLRSMSRFDVDLFVIGGGSGGVRGARVAAEHGAKVAVAEYSKWGGTCVVRGCVPKKLFVYSSEVARQIDDARGHGWTIPEATFDWPTLIAAKDNEIARLSGAYVSRLQKAGCEVIEGRARLVDPHTLEVNGRTVTAAHILVAVGGRPRLPERGTWISSDEAFHLEQLPKRIAIVGGGYIAVEFAHVFKGFGCDVTIIHRDQRVLRGFDPDIREQVHLGLVRAGIHVEPGVKLVDRDAGHVIVCDDKGDRGIETDLAMAAIGRLPNTEGLGLVEAGVKLSEHGGVIVDEYSKSSVDHIYAVGDVTERVALTPVAIREGHAVADSLFGGRPTPVHHHLIPTAVFAQPSAASVGLSEPGAIAAGIDVQVFKTKFRPMRYALSGRDEQVLIKLIVDKKTDVVVGLHMVGPDAPEIVQSAAIAITMKATKADFDRTFAMHPTTAEELVLLR